MLFSAFPPEVSQIVRKIKLKHFLFLVRIREKTKLLCLIKIWEYSGRDITRQFWLLEGNVCESTKCIVKMIEIKLIFRANITVQFGIYIGSINSIIRSL